jgi:hypothetical protein
MNNIWIRFAMSLLAVAGMASAEDAPKMKKFLMKPLVIEDQGSFFIGECAEGHQLREGAI